MTDPFAPDAPAGSESFDDDEESVRPGPFRRHALWAAGVAAAGVAMGWVTSLFRIGPEEYGLPPAAPGSLWPYLTAWAVIGLVVAGVLRATAARIPVYAPGRTAVALTYLGTRLSLGRRPEAPLVAAMAAAALVAAAVWCAVALHQHRRRAEA
ncbi:hypothetical protein EAO70_07420 [Streptomyces sp. adm13(2018)]|uniref:hypothetical protein n=1 Tax=Streptomyces sp. adm13(2018) TaxID=2479007 RepID=UPI0011CD8BF3|nr:hypothetical protein [Streptomyces sp. adm13(2018)]TXS21777.1 hypothetical protein EAO70_07420 [Streptomyces sp. adm13(2018)]